MKADFSNVVRGPVKITLSPSIGFTKLESTCLSNNSEISSFVLTWLFVEKYPQCPTLNHWLVELLSLNKGGDRFVLDSLL